MRKLTTVFAGVVLLAAAGFASAGIATGGHLLAVLTGSTTTIGTGTASVTTGTTPIGRKVTICHRTGSKKHPFHTISVDQHAVPAHLRHGDHLGACTATASSTTTVRGKKKTVKTKGTTHTPKTQGNPHAPNTQGTTGAPTPQGNSGNGNGGNGGNKGASGAGNNGNGNGNGHGGGGGHGNGNGK